MSFLSSPASLLAQFYPIAPFNFEAPVDPGANVPPMQAILRVASERLAQMESDILLLLSQMTVQEAAGRYLDLHGVLYGIPRIIAPNYELDGHYRARILAGTKKLTIPAIRAVVQSYYRSILPANQQPTVDVYDLQSNPTKSAAANLVIFQFCIDVDFQVLASTAFFFDRSYLDTNDFLMDSGATKNTPSDPILAAIVNATKAANTEPVWIQRFHFVDSYS
jgi:hypothetical protein